MTTLREAAQQALEAMESVEWYGAGSGWMVDADAIEKAITALKAALAEPPDSTKLVAESEPVAWIHADPDKPGLKFLEWREDAFGYEGEWTKTPLYTAPPQHKPLTEEEIHDCWQQKHRDKVAERRLITRAVERAHGIGGSK